MRKQRRIHLVLAVGVLLGAALSTQTGCRRRSTPLMPRTDQAMMNERYAADALNRIARAEFLWRQRDMDADGVLNFYVADLTFLEAQGGEHATPPFHIPEGLLKADQGRFGADAVPYHGYYFAAMTRNGDNIPYLNAQRFEFGFEAWPAGYRDGGLRTFIVNQEGRVYAKDHAGGTQITWPEPNPAKRGWVEATFPGWAKAFPEEQ